MPVAMAAWRTYANSPAFIRSRISGRSRAMRLTRYWSRLPLCTLCGGCSFLPRPGPRHLPMVLERHGGFREALHVADTLFLVIHELSSLFNLYKLSGIPLSELVVVSWRRGDSDDLHCFEPLHPSFARERGIFQGLIASFLAPVHRCSLPYGGSLDTAFHLSTPSPVACSAASPARTRSTRYPSVQRVHPRPVPGTCLCRHPDARGSPPRGDAGSDAPVLMPAPAQAHGPRCR